MRRAEGAQAGGILLRLGGNGGKLSQGAPGERGEAGVAAGRFFRQAGIDEQQWNAYVMAGGHQVGPDLGLQDEADAGPEVAEKTAHRTGVVVGQIGPQDPVAEQLLRGLPAGGGHVGEQDAVLRVAGEQRGHQGLGRPRLAH